jgi:hypothetical protein
MLTAVLASGFVHVDVISSARLVVFAFSRQVVRVHRDVNQCSKILRKVENWTSPISSVFKKFRKNR